VRHHRPDAYSAEQVLLNKRQIYGGAPKLHWYQHLYYFTVCPSSMKSFSHLSNVIQQKLSRSTHFRECMKKHIALIH